jgi:hypothetical protein
VPFARMARRREKAKGEPGERPSRESKFTGADYRR